MKIQGTFRNVGTTDTWQETHEYPTIHYKDPNAKDKAKELLVHMVAQFNEHLRPSEKAREVLKGKILGPSTDHDWQKTNLVTIKKGGRMYDTSQCSQCGATGKRFGVSQVVLDRPTQAKCTKGI